VSGCLPTDKKPTKRVGLVQTEHHYHLIECNYLFRRDRAKIMPYCNKYTKMY
jgi:hypothetical protein